MTLTDGKQGKDYKVKCLSGDREVRRRLLDLGFVRGTVVRICNIAPFKVTFLVSLRGYMLAVRRTTCECIHIEG